MEETKQNFIKIDLIGLNETLFENLRGHLIAKINDVLDCSTRDDNGVSIKSLMEKHISSGSNNSTPSQYSPGVSNYKVFSEIKEKFSQIERSKAEARKINAEAKSLEFEQKLKELKLTFKMTKSLLIGQQGEEAIAFTKQLESFVEIIDSLQESQKLN